MVGELKLFRGGGSSAGLQPEPSRDALLCVCTLIMALYAIKGEINNINVGFKLLVCVPRTGRQI